LGLLLDFGLLGIAQGDGAAHSIETTHISITLVDHQRLGGVSRYHLETLPKVQQTLTQPLLEQQPRLAGDKLGGVV
jgi:hypothetical protein